MTLLAAVVFDFDGVIIDSETAEFEAHRLIFEQCGVTLTPDEWCHHIGTWLEKDQQRWFTRLRALSDRAPDLATFHAEARRLFQERIARAPMRGVRELVDALAAAHVRMAIASTSPARWVVPTLERLGLSDRFQTVVTADDVTRRKPAPDVYLEAARRLEAAPARSVAIEDSAPGLAAAAAAGMKTVAIPHWLTEGHDLARATLRVGHAGELNVDVLQRLLTND